MFDRRYNFHALRQGDDTTMGGETRPGEGGSFAIKELWSTNGIGGTYAIPVYHEGSLFGTSRGAFVCVDAATGATRWSSPEPENTGRIARVHLKRNSAPPAN